jgi:hypothetical protein
LGAVLDVFGAELGAQQTHDSVADAVAKI